MRAVRAGDDRAFEVIYERHVAGLLAFSRHMLGSTHDAEDAVQQTFVSALGDLRRSERPIALKAWLYTIARNRCLSMLRGRRPEGPPPEDVPVPGLQDEVFRRDELRALVADLGALPEDQRAALLLHEVGDLSHVEIAGVIGVAPHKVKAIVFRARSALIDFRRARETPCIEVREQLSVLRGGSLRRRELRRHLQVCSGCAAFREEIRQQRIAFGIALPVIPSAALREQVFAAVGLSGSTAAAGGVAAVVATQAPAVSAGATGGAGAAAGAGAAVGASGLGAAGASVAAKVAVVVALAGGAGAGVVAVERNEPVRASAPAGAGSAGSGTASAGLRPTFTASFPGAAIGLADDGVPVLAPATPGMADPVAATSPFAALGDPAAPGGPTAIAGRPARGKGADRRAAARAGQDAAGPGGPVAALPGVTEDSGRPVKGVERLTEGAKRRTEAPSRALPGRGVDAPGRIEKAKQRGSRGADRVVGKAPSTGGGRSTPTVPGLERRADPTPPGLERRADPVVPGKTETPPVPNPSPPAVGRPDQAGGGGVPGPPVTPRAIPPGLEQTPKVKGEVEIEVPPVAPVVP